MLLAFVFFVRTPVGLYPAFVRSIDELIVPPYFDHGFIPRLCSSRPQFVEVPPVRGLTCAIDGSYCSREYVSYVRGAGSPWVVCPIRLSVHGEMNRGKAGVGSSPGVRSGRALSLAICRGGLLFCRIPSRGMRVAILAS